MTGAQTEPSVPSPGPMTIDIGSLFSSARRVKGVKARGGSSMQPVDDAPKHSQASKAMRQKPALQLQDNHASQPQVTQTAPRNLGCCLTSASDAVFNSTIALQAAFSAFDAGYHLSDV